MLLVLGVFAARLVQVQAIDAPELAAEALGQRLVTSQIDVQRADIVDRNGAVLATSIERVHIWVNQEKIADWKRVSNGQTLAAGPGDAARILAPILGMEEQQLEALLTGERSFQYLARDISNDVWDLVSAERIAGLDFEPTSERIYPNGAVAGNVIGFVGGRDDVAGRWGIAGLEYAFEEALLGTPGSLTYERGGGNLVIPTGVREESPAVPGSTLVTTLDRDLQWLTQQRLARALTDTGAESGVIIVEDIRTGEIYALADSSSVDPRDAGASAAADRGSRAASSVFEPGSTGKIITMAALIEEGLATPTSRYIAPFEYATNNGQVFRDSHEHADWQLTLAGILVRSSNTGTVRAGQRLTLDQRYDYLSTFGLGDRTGVGLPGESGGILHDSGDWDGRTKFAVLFGQGVSVTALQTTQVYATIANGGVRVQPTVVQGFEQADGTFVPRDVADPERVISEDTAAQLMRMLESVVADGTGQLAQVDSYRVAGKTGTAQAAGPDGEMTSIVASFVGVAPADNPRIVVSVILFNPQSSVWGGDVAAPVFADVMTQALQALRVPPSVGDANPYPITWE